MSQPQHEIDKRKLAWKRIWLIALMVGVALMIRYVLIYTAG